MLGEVGDVLSTNMYAYTENNPVMNYDPSGYMSDEYNDVNEDEPTLARVEGEGFTDPVEEISSDINVEPEKTANADGEKSFGVKTNYINNQIAVIGRHSDLIKQGAISDGQFALEDMLPDLGNQKRKLESKC